MVLNREQLIDHLDSIRSGRGSADMDAKIASDPETSQQWNQLRLIVDAVEQAALYEQIGTVRAVWIEQQNTPLVAPQQNNAAIVRQMSFSRVALRAAAVILVIGASAAIYKYAVTSSAGMYSANFTSYDLNTSRGATAQDEMEEAYKAKNWVGVDDAFKKKKVKDNKSYFLEGMTDMEKKKYDEAIGMFQQVMAANTLSGSDYFEDEAEFYLAMSWLARGDVKEAMPLFEKIRNDKNHLYHDVVVKMSSMDLRIAAYKDLK
jgi:tetratricopeptide (TPR) repeat protein